VDDLVDHDLAELELFTIMTMTATTTTVVLDSGLLTLIKAAVLQALLVVMSEEEGLEEKHDGDTDNGDG
jgi:hypothetical protein